MANAGFIFANGMPRARRPKPRTMREYIERKLEDRPETAAMQRAETLTREEKARWAIDVMTRDAIESERMSGNNAPSEESLRANVARIARRHEAKEK